MTQSQTQPTIARRAVGRALRRHREAARMSIADAAAETGLGRDTISRLEEARGKRGAKLPIVRDLCRIYEVDPIETSRLVGLALDSGKRGWWERYPDGNIHLQPLYLETEQTATDLRTLDLEFIPGLLQSPAYIDEIMAASRMSAEAIEGVRNLRIHRQVLMFERPSLPEMRFAIGMGAIGYLDAMPANVKAEQLAHLNSMAKRPGINIRIIRQVGPTLGSFTLLTSRTNSGDHETETVVYVDGLDGCRYIEDPAVIRLYKEPFKLAFDSATPIEEYT
ncbi:helix-turn-helix domain-containing protein [Natronoglycomyces albus]|uniref:Helix-turn-helix domain-containing protein n=1 Tax=Natronoglycomyces albus TaxID=2811108 RepID=A0A895XTU7_9ACTN|nr:helix-turn-helix transcriptional regulator [Natronoglycomyces albus]QSB05946.1 helix-turn-helix domain-containing protein [Natronoglycomyces albus]